MEKEDLEKALRAIASGEVFSPREAACFALGWPSPGERPSDYRRSTSATAYVHGAKCPCEACVAQSDAYYIEHGVRPSDATPGTVDCPICGERCQLDQAHMCPPSARRAWLAARHTNEVPRLPPEMGNLREQELLGLNAGMLPEVTRERYEELRTLAVTIAHRANQRPDYPIRVGDRVNHKLANCRVRGVVKRLRAVVDVNGREYEYDVDNLEHDLREPTQKRSDGRG